MHFFKKYRYLPLGEVRVLNTIQIVFVSLLGAIFLKEPCGPTEVQNVVVIMLGIVMVTQPPFMFQKDDFIDNQGVGSATHYLIEAAQIFGALGQAVTVVASRHQKGIPLSVQLFWTSTLPFVLGMIFCYIFGGLKIPKADVFPSLFFFTISSVMGEATLILSVRYELASYAIVVRKVLDILLAFLIQVVWFHQVPKTLAVLGVILLCSTMILEGIRKNQRNKNN